MGFQQGITGLVLMVCAALLLTGQSAHAQLLPGFSEPAPYQTPAEDDYQFRPMLKPPAPKAPVVLTPPASMRPAPIVLKPPVTQEPAPIVLTPPQSAARRTPLLLAMPGEDGNAAPPPQEISEDKAPTLALPLVQASETQVPTPTSRGSYDENAPVDLVADRMEHDDQTGKVTAAGNVELTQSGRVLRAEEVSYNVNTGKVTAHGHVVLKEPNGDVHFAENVELSEEMTKGFVEGLQSYLSDGGQFKAQRGERISTTLLTMHEASYTPCDCDLDKDGDPVWRIRAEKITYDETKHKVTYKNAKFELFGTPVFWTPYLAHSDGKIKRKSGLLTPGGGYDSELGAILTQNYYWDIAPDRDATVGGMLTTQQNPVALAQYRQRWARGDLVVDGSLTYSGRTDDIAGQNVQTGDEWRGHINADGLWDINDKWRAGVNIAAASDDQYLRQYNFEGEDVLESEIYAERFAGRNYAAVRAMAFQDVRVRELQTEQPHVLPEAVISLTGAPNATLGGRWSLDASALGLVRDGSGQDMTRGSLQAGWQRRDTTSFGLVNTIDLSVRGDAYSVGDRDIALDASGRSRDSTATRVFPQAHMVTSYPMAKPLERAQLLVEPIAAITVGTNIDVDDNSIPNEDSQDVQIDSTNLFEPNRFPGLDRIEDRSRVTYGLRSGVYGYGGSHLTGFIGQSYNFHQKDNPFPSGSGLSRQESDIVGSLSALYNQRFGLNYRFQVDSDGFASQRHEFDGYAHWRKLSLGSRYLFAKGLGGTTIDDSREQVEGNLAYFLTESWRTRLGGLYDLGDEDSGLRRAVMGLDYYGCCMNLSLTAERNLTADSSGDSGTSVMFRVGLKGLGQFESARDNQWGGQAPSSMARNW